MLDFYDNLGRFRLQLVQISQNWVCSEGKRSKTLQSRKRVSSVLTFNDKESINNFIYSIKEQPSQRVC